MSIRMIVNFSILIDIYVNGYLDAESQQLQTFQQTFLDQHWGSSSTFDQISLVKVAVMLDQFFIYLFF